MLDFYDTFYFIIVFVLIFTVFYIVFNTFKYNITFKNTDDVNNKINIIASELKNINSKIESTETQVSDNFYIKPIENYTEDTDSDSESDSENESLRSEITSYKKLLKQKNKHINKLKQKNENQELKSILKQLKNKSSENKNIDNEDKDNESSEGEFDIVINKNNNNGGAGGGRGCGKTVVFDPIANYDNAKLMDPLVDPLQRTSADQIPTPSVAMQLNFPTQGVLDKYHRIGLLVALDSENNSNNHNESNNIVKRGNNRVAPQVPIVTDEKERTYKGVWLKENGKIEGFGNIAYDDNQILELIGKRRYHEVYRYYTSISMGNKIIKVMVNNKNKRELYTGDIVHIKELNKNYRVEIDDMDMIEYNPYVI